jgi:hypothetical protein
VLSPLKQQKGEGHNDKVKAGAEQASRYASGVVWAVSAEKEEVKGDKLYGTNPGFEYTSGFKCYCSSWFSELPGKPAWRECRSQWREYDRNFEEAEERYHPKCEIGGGC